MEVSIQGKNMELSGLSRQNIAEKLEVVEKYLTGTVEASVFFDHQKHTTRVEVVIKAGRISIRGASESPNAARAVDEAVSRVEVQLRRRKDRVKGHRARHSVRGDAHEETDAGDEE